MTGDAAAAPNADAAAVGGSSALQPGSSEPVGDGSGTSSIAAAAGSSADSGDLAVTATTATPTATEGEGAAGASASPAKSPLKGFRIKPEWVPTLEIRLAMVKSPRKKKAAAPVGGKPAAKKAGGIGGMAKGTVKV